MFDIKLIDIEKPPIPTPASWHNQPGTEAGYGAFQQYVRDNQNQAQASVAAAIKENTADDTEDPAEENAVADLLATRFQDFVALLESYLDDRGGNKNQAEELQGGNGYVVDGGAGDDEIIGGNNANIAGGDGDDDITAGNNANISGDNGDDTISVQNNGAVWGGNGNDTINGYNDLLADGGNGDDIINGYDNLIANGGNGDDTIGGYDNARLNGDNGNDALSGYDNAQLFGGNGNDTLSGYNDSLLKGGRGDDVLSAYRNSRLYGGDGDDVLRGYDGTYANGGRGDDVISGYDNSHLNGGAGNDTIDAYDNAVIDAGSGDDTIDTYDNALINAGAGDDVVHSYAGATVVAGSGDDVVKGGPNSRFYGGAGNDRLSGSLYSALHGGDGDDWISVGTDSMVAGGAGNDRVFATNNAIAAGGTGDDYIHIGENATILYAKGDGHDTIDAKRKSFDEMADLSSGRILFGPDIKAEDLDIVRRGPHLVINVSADDSMTIRNIDAVGSPSLHFTDGSTLNADEIAQLTRVDDSALSEGLKTAGNEIRTGTDGDDSLHAGNRVSVRGGAGNDTVSVGDGSTVYFGRGDGDDTIQGSHVLTRIATQKMDAVNTLENSRVLFDADITPADVTVRRDGEDLVISLNDGSGSLRVPPDMLGQVRAPALEFADGTRFSPQVVNTLADARTNVTA